MSLAGEHVLVTGGTGYIGSHTVLQLLAAGAAVTIVDNLVNSSEKVLPRLHALAGEEAAKRLRFAKVGGLAGWMSALSACVRACARVCMCV